MTSYEDLTANNYEGTFQDQNSAPELLIKQGENIFVSYRKEGPDYIPHLAKNHLTDSLYSRDDLNSRAFKGVNIEGLEAFVSNPDSFPKISRRLHKIREARDEQERKRTLEESGIFYEDIFGPQPA